MAELPDPGRKSKGPIAPQPLPRLWRAESSPETSDAAPDEKSRKKKPKAEAEAAPPPKAKKAKKGEGREKRPDGTTKIEETPKYDTYETRQRVRWAIGSTLAAILVIGLFVVVSRFRQREPEVVNTAPDPRVRAAAEKKEALEQEARNLLENARSAAQNGKTPAALDLFNKVANSYPGTAASREAMEALDRHRKKLPLLAASPSDLPSAPKPPPPGTNPVAMARAPEPGAATGPVPPSPETETAPKPPPAAMVTAPSTPTVPSKPLPAGFKAKPGTAVHASGWPMEIVCVRDDAPMVFVPGGSFTMGRDDGEPPERPSHRVTLASFYIDQHEVTARQYQQFVKETGRPTDSPGLLEDLPAVNVGARDAKAYCLWAGKSLPTEAQWEMAARGEDGRIFPWGNEPPSWDRPRTPKQVEPVMSQSIDVSPYGAFDMAGNAWEWTGDIYDPRYFQQFKSSVAVDPVGPPQGRSRLILVTVKGGSKSWQAFWRDGIKVESRQPHLGFRGALQADRPATPAAPAPATAPGVPALPGGVVPF